VFPGQYADAPCENLSPLLKRVWAKAGLPETFRPLRSQRDPFASWLASSGKVSMYEPQKFITHSLNFDGPLV
jgi:hypothetical protein